MLRLFGSFRLNEVGLSFERATYLLAVLAVRGTWVTRDELCLLLWSEDTDVEQARMRLRQLLYRSKKLGLAKDLETENGCVRYTGQSDVQLLKKAFLQHDFSAGLDLYQGALLETAIPYKIPELLTYLDIEREQLRTEVRQATLEVMRQNPAQAHIWLEKMLRIEPLDEVLLLRTLEFPNLAARALEWHLLALKTVGLEPEAGLLERFASGRQQDLMPVLGLPKPTSVFKGRQLELEQIASFWQQPANRLLSLVGLGGIGKTRLALEVAEHFQGLVVFAPLVSVEDAQLVPRLLLEQLGLSGDTEQTLLLALQNESLLLVLDNLEQVLEIRFLVAKILLSCPKIRILCTSREILGLQAEQVFYLEGLPALVQNLPLTEQAAAQVFLAAAKRLAPQFQLTETDFLPLSRIHSAIAGTPLGLELAAGWLRVFSLAEIATQVENDHSILTTDAPDVPIRQRSFAALFQSSWRLLSPDEQTALSQLAVLRSGFTLQFARQITGVLMPTLLRLVNKSFIKRSDGLFFLHELIRQHAVEYLSGEAKIEALDVLGEVIFEQALEWHEKCDTREYVRLSQKLELEQDNLRLVLEDSFNRKPQRAVQLVSLLWYFWYARAYYEEGGRWLARAVILNAPDTQTRVELLTGFAYMIQDRSRYNEGYAAADEIQNLSPDNPMHQAMADRVRGAVALNEPDLERSEQCFSRARAKFFDLDLKHYAICTQNLGIVKVERGDFLGAKPLLEEAIGLLRDLGGSLRLAAALTSLARVLGSIGDVETQAQLLEQAQICSEEVGDMYQLSGIYINWANNAVQRRQPNKARDYLQTGLRIAWKSKLMTLIGLILIELVPLETEPKRALYLIGAIKAHWQDFHYETEEQERHSLETIRANSGFDATQCHLLELKGGRLSLGEVIQYALENSQQLVST